MPSILTKDLIPGHKYQDINGDVYVYVGYCSEIAILNPKGRFLQKFNDKSGYYVYLDKEDCDTFFSNEFPEKFASMIKHLTRRSRRKLDSDVGIDRRFAISLSDRVVSTINENGYVIVFRRK